ncbi:MAG TPA: EAL domain-containing response regulator [Xanthobacteraceae bacterium]|nr:EAL domain-containing response regulator [Xanthobacteraceae bacterium]
MALNEPSSPSPESALPGAAAARPPPRRRCVVVEDEPAIRKVFAAALGGEMDLGGFASAQELLDGWRPDHPDMIFLDIALDRSDAIDVIRALATHKYRGAVQIVSGRDRILLDQVKRVGEQHGLTMLTPLQKPFRAAQLKALTQDYFAQMRGRDTAAATPAAMADDFGLAISLNEILANGWLRFYYQPKMDLQRKCIVGAEVLARCRHPDRGMIPPGAFLPDADEESLRKLSQRALTAALESWSSFANAGFPLKLAINLTVEDLINLPIRDLARDLRPSDARWPGLILELTEAQAVRDIAVTQEIATQLRIYDVALALDDLGAGYSHIARLKELPFAEVKLDRALVANCGEDRHNASLCETAIDLAHHFGATVVAEGIEKRSELQALTAMGCDMGQGFLFAPPMPQDRLIVLLKEQAQKFAIA